MFGGMDCLMRLIILGTVMCMVCCLYVDNDHSNCIYMISGMSDNLFSYVTFASFDCYVLLTYILCLIVLSCNVLVFCILDLPYTNSLLLSCIFSCIKYFMYAFSTNIFLCLCFNVH